MPRVVDKKLLKAIKAQPCIVCQARNCDPCHIKTRGSGGDDTWDNVIPMCRTHHIEQTQIGWKKFCSKHLNAWKALNDRGWELVDEFGVWKLRKISGAASDRT